MKTASQKVTAGDSYKEMDQLSCRTSRTLDCVSDTTHMKRPQKKRKTIAKHVPEIDPKAFLDKKFRMTTGGSNTFSVMSVAGKCE